MPRIAEIAAFLEEFAPARLAAEWDNVGLLVGDSEQRVERLMTCLTVTPDSVAEAISERSELIVTHHPFPFRPLERLTRDTPQGRMLLDLIRAGVAVYSPHTAFDSARGGINQRLAEGIGLADIGPLVPDAADPALGTGRKGRAIKGGTLADVATQVKKFLLVESVHMVGDSQLPVSVVAVACGSAGELLDAARQAGCSAMVTGEARFHTCLEAEATGVGLVLAGHYASERFGVEHLAQVLGEKFPQLQAWASRSERDPVSWL